ncbi:MAG: winged helix-turn-helix domain-containing tetratricopeptide repeat protein [Hyphomicrobiaceae bacterium]
MIYVFGTFELDTARFELRDGGTRLGVEPQVFSIIQLLVENRHRMVSKSEMMDVVWDGRIVSESAVSSRIRSARKVLGDSGKSQRLIRTVHGQGLRFVAEVQVIDREAARPDNEGRSFDQVVPGDARAIGVLPFINMSDDPEQDYFAHGITEDITTALSNVKTFAVLARNSTSSYKDESVDIRRIGLDLNINYVIEGSVRRSGNRVRVTAQLINASTGDQLWAERYDGTLDDIFDLQDRITSKIVGTIEPELVRAEGLRLQGKPPDNMDAYDYLLRGLACMHKLTREETAKGRAHFEKAIELDPNYGRAYAFATWVYRRGVQERGLASLSEDDRRNAVVLARNALRCDRNDPSVLVYASITFSEIERNLEEASALLDRALTMHPNSHRFWNAKARLLAQTGDTEQAIEAGERAISVSPNDPGIWVTYWSIAEAHLQELRYEQAVEFAKRAIRHNENVGPAYYILAAASAHLGRETDAQEALAAALKINPGMTMQAFPESYHVALYKNLGAYLEGLRKAGLPG